MVNIFDKIRDPADADKQRLHRSEVLLTQLYRNEITPSFRVPDMRGIKILAYFSVLAVVVFMGTLFYKFNAFIVLREDVMSKSANLEAAIQRRGNLFSNVINLTLNYAALERSVFTDTAKMRTEIAKNSNPSPGAIKEMLGKAVSGKGSGGALFGDLGKALGALGGGVAGGGAPLGQLRAVVEQYPNIKSSETYKQTIMALVDMEDLISTRRLEHNTSIRKYNASISKFPWKMLAHWTDFKRVEYYSIDDSLKGRPSLTKDVYEQLMPMTPLKLKGQAK